MDQNRIEHAIRAALIADAYALGAHWIYDGKVLGALTIDWDELNAPQAHWHKGKVKGDFTHYGDHGKWLYDYVRETAHFDISEYRDYWLAKMKTYNGYIDASTRETLEVLADNPGAIEGSASTELSIVGRIAPLLLVSSDKDQFLDHVARFAALTHNSSRVLKVAQLFACVLHSVVSGSTIPDALANEPIDPELNESFDAAHRAQIGQRT